MGRKFTMIDEPFECAVCGAKVQPLKYTARDHCPSCLRSLHLDNFPGDRENECHGVLEPIGLQKYKDTYKIVYRCSKCGEEKRNIMASDDNMKLIIELSAKPM